MFFRHHLIAHALFSPADDAGGAGGGAPGPFTEESIKNLIAAQVAGALKTFAGTFQKQITDAVKSTVTEATSGIDALLETKLEGLKSGSAGGAGAGAGAGAGGAGASGGGGVGGVERPEDHPAYKGLQRQLEAQRKEIERITTSAANAEKAKREMALQQRAVEELAKHGVRAHAKAAWASLRPMLSYENDDSERAIFRDEDGSEFDLKPGIEAWAKNRSNQIFVDPRGAAGSGGRGSNGANGAGGTGKQKSEAGLEDLGNFVMDAFAPTKFGG